jgi:hypothetical protein
LFDPVDEGTLFLMSVAQIFQLFLEPGALILVHRQLLKNLE